jgi:hypothetical protein
MNGPMPNLKHRITCIALVLALSGCKTKLPSSAVGGRLAGFSSIRAAEVHVATCAVKFQHERPESGWLMKSSNSGGAFTLDMTTEGIEIIIKTSSKATADGKYQIDWTVSATGEDAKRNTAAAEALQQIFDRSQDKP